MQVLVGGKLHARDEEAMGPGDRDAMHANPEQLRAEESIWRREGEDASATETETDDGTHGDLQAQDFVFHALEGGSGEVRWTHAAGDWEANTSPHDLLHPQHGIHKGELDWRAFRHSLMDSLPHSWSSREDTSFELARFARRRSGRDRQGEIEKKKKHSTTITHGQTSPPQMSTHARSQACSTHLLEPTPLARMLASRFVHRAGRAIFVAAAA
jgi:hypothetical protein